MLGAGYYPMLTLVAGAGMLGIATALNTITEFGTCSVVFSLVGALLTFLVSSIRTLDRISFIGWCVSPALYTFDASADRLSPTGSVSPGS